AEGDAEIVRLAAPGPAAHRVRFSPDGQFLFANFWVKQSRVWDLASGQTVLELETGLGDGPADFSSDGRTIAVAHVDNTVRLYELPSGAELKRFAVPSALNAVQFAPDGRMLAIAPAQAGVVQLVSLDGELRTALPHPARVIDVAWRDDGRYLA